MLDETGQSGYLVTEKLVKRFDDALAVDDVTLSVAKGEIFALLGSSGCGKSTLLRMLAGFESPTSGRILLGAQDIASFAPYQRPINMMFQSYALFPHLDIFPCGFHLRSDACQHPFGVQSWLQFGFPNVVEAGEVQPIRLSAP